METEVFEEKLQSISKPMVRDLKHTDLLPDMIVRSKDYSVIGGWWLSIPIYLLAMMLMKTAFKRGSSFLENIHDVEHRLPFACLLFFGIAPIAFLILNLVAARQVYILKGGRRNGLFTISWWNILISVICIIIFLIYLI